MSRAAVDEAKQALWRDKEIARRIRREQEDAIECINLRNETLALYDEVRRRHAKEDELERMGMGYQTSYEEPERIDPEAESIESKDPKNESIYPGLLAAEERVEMIKFEPELKKEETEHIGWGSFFSSNDDD